MPAREERNRNPGPTPPHGLTAGGRQLASDIARLVTLRLELAATEGREATSRAGRGIALALAAAVFLLVADIAASAALVGLVTRWLSSHWPGFRWEFAALTLAALHGLAAWRALRTAQASFTAPVLPETVAQFKQDQEWLAQNHRNDPPA